MVRDLLWKGTYTEGKNVIQIWIAAAVLGLLSTCRGSEGITTITGVGATLPYPLYAAWQARFQQIEPNVHINYQALGSGAGVRQLIARTVDFGATDEPLTDAELAMAPAPIVHIPTAVGGVAVVYNVSGLPSGLMLDATVLADIFLGRLSIWNDAAIAALNPRTPLPALRIVVVHRSDGSGTTAALTRYLAATSVAWSQQVGAGKAVRWPSGVGAKGNEGVAAQVQRLAGGIGYVELASARQTQLGCVALRNRAGRFVEPSSASITAAATGIGPRLPGDLRASIVDAAGEDAYPIAAFTYVLVYDLGASSPKQAALRRYLGWAIHAGQTDAVALAYGALPASITRLTEAKLRDLQPDKGTQYGS